MNRNTPALNAARRSWLVQTLQASVALGIRSLACGLPPAVLLNPTRALAQHEWLARAATSPLPPQFLILSSSSRGDPINCNVPGTYTSADMVHPLQASMAPTDVTLGGQVYKAAAPWATMGPALANTCFFHHATNTFNHPDQDLVQQLGSAIDDNEQLISAVSKLMSKALGTIQVEPISLAAEGIKFAGKPQPKLSPRGVAAILGGTKNLAALMDPKVVAQRDKDLDAFHALIKKRGGSVQQAFLDRYALSQVQARQASANAAASLAALSKIADDKPDNQLLAALALVKMKLAPAVFVHLNFGDDNHNDTGLATEAAAHVTSLATLNNSYLSKVTAADNVTFASLNVFGRDNGSRDDSGATKGRDHNGLHSTLVMHGPNLASSVVGGMTVAKFGASSSRAVALGIDSATGAGSATGDIAAKSTLASAGATLAAALGVEAAAIAKAMPGAVVVKPALA